MTIGDAVVALMLAAAAPVSPVDPILLHVEFVAPEDCSSADEFYQGIRSRTDRVRLAMEDQPGYYAHVRLTREGDRVRGQLRIVDKEGASDVRSVMGDSCNEVAQALSLTATLALDPTARLTPKPEPPPPPCPEPPPPEPCLTLSPPTPCPKKHGHVEVGAQFSVADVVSPELLSGGGVFTRLTWADDPTTGPSVGLALLHLRNDLLSAAGDALYRWTAFAVTACPMQWNVAGAFQVEPCVLGLAGWISGTGREVDFTTSAIRSWWSGGAMARVAGPVDSAVAVHLDLGLTFPVYERRFITTTSVGAATVERDVGATPTVSPMASLGIGYRF